MRNAVPPRRGFAAPQGRSGGWVTRRFWNLSDGTNVCGSRGSGAPGCSPGTVGILGHGGGGAEPPRSRGGVAGGLAVNVELCGPAAVHLLELLGDLWLP